MALSQSDLTELLESLRAGDSVEMIRRALQRMLQELIEAEATTVIGAAPYQRSPERTTQRNGHRERLLTSAAGDLELQIPKLRSGSFLAFAVVGDALAEVTGGACACGHQYFPF